MPSMSKSKFSSKRGKVHGAVFKQTKGVLSPERQVPAHIERPPYARGLGVPRDYPPPQIHSAAGQDKMRKAAAVAAEVLDRAGELVKAGISTDQIDDFVHRFTISRGAYPSPLGYMGFPKSVCASINEVVCHGMPDSTIIRPGDIVKLDVSCYIGGVHGDTCRTFVAGGLGTSNTDLDDVGRHLVTTTKRALDSAITICGPGVNIGSVGSHIQSILDTEELQGVSAFAGHGIGDIFHTEPIVYHHKNHSRYTMRPGMTFTIEPMVTEGTGNIEIWEDEWTIVSADGGRSAQFEHTLLITDHGAEVLTRYE